MRFSIALLLLLAGCDSVLDLDRFVFDVNGDAGSDVAGPDVPEDVEGQDVPFDAPDSDTAVDAISDAADAVDAPLACDERGNSTWVQVGDDMACANSNERIYCWGRGSILGLGLARQADSPVEILSASADVSTPGRLDTSWEFVIGFRNGFAFPADDVTETVLRAWGSGLNGLFNEGTDAPQPEDRPHSFPTVNPVRSAILPAVGTHHACHVSPGTTNLRCWGTNTNNRLGRLGSMGEIVSAGLTLPPDPPLDVDVSWAQLSSRRTHTCALTSSGEIYAFGGSTLVGMQTLGRFTGEPADPRFMATPMKFAPDSGAPEGTTATQVSCGRDLSCYITSVGELYCLGSGLFRRLGGPGVELARADRGSSILGRTDWVGVSAGDDSACAWTADELYCWGDNRGGEVGLPAEVRSVGPTLVEGFDGVLTADAGNNSSCAVDRCGFVYCWGSDMHGQLGQGAGDQSSHLPQRVTLP